MVNILNKFTKFFYKNKRKRSEYYYRMIWIGCMSVCIPVIMIGGLFYYLASTSLKQQIKSETSSSLIIFKERVERILETIELESHQIATNPLINDSLSVAQFNQDIFNQLNILEKLKISKIENSFIKEVYYYNSHDDFILSNLYGYITYDAFKYRQDIEMLTDSKENVSWIHLPVSSKEGYISYARKLPNLAESDVKGILVMQVKMDPFQNYFPTEKYQTSFILDQNNRLLFQTDEIDRDIQINNESALNKIKNSNEKTGMFYAENYNGSQVLYTYDKSSTFGRTYVSMIPKNSFVEQMSWFRWMILSSVLFFLGMGVLLTLYNTRRAYNPIKQLMSYSKLITKETSIYKQDSELTIIKDSIENLIQEKQKLGNFKEQVEPTLREWFFQQVLEENFTFDKFFYKKCNEYNIPIHSNYVVMVFNLDFGEGNREEDDNRQLLSFAVKKIFLELVQRDKSYEGIDFNTIQNNLVAVIRFNLKLSNEEIKEKLLLASNETYELVQEYLSLTISVGVGRVYPQINEVVYSYQDAVIALKYRIHKDPEVVLFMEDLETNKMGGLFFYPRELENRIVESLKLGDIEQAERTLNEFTQAISSIQSYNSIYQCFHLLLSSIVFSLEKQGKSIIDILEPDLFGQVKALHTLEEIKKWFVHYLFHLYQQLCEENETSPGSIAIKQVCQFINDHISQDITLTGCAEMVNLTPSYLSRLFKKEVGINFREYVLIKKVEKAKNLSVETDARVGEIAEAVGYSERNLNRLFQRYVDMTLSQYRNNHR